MGAVYLRLRAILSIAAPATTAVRVPVVAESEITQGVFVYPNPIRGYTMVQSIAGAQIVHDVTDRVIYSGRTTGNVHTIDMHSAVHAVFCAGTIGWGCCHKESGKQFS